MHDLLFFLEKGDQLEKKGTFVVSAITERSTFRFEKCYASGQRDLLRVGRECHLHPFYCTRVEILAGLPLCYRRRWIFRETLMSGGKTRKVDPEVDPDVVALLIQWDVDHEAVRLAKNGVLKMIDLESMTHAIVIMVISRSQVLEKEVFLSNESTRRGVEKCCTSRP